MKYLRISLAATVALLLLAGCGSTLNDVLGTGTNYPTNTQSYSGNVNYIDFNARRIDLNSNGYTTSIYWDSNTRFTYQNQNVNPNSIRTGDYVTIQAYNNGNGQLLAQNVADNGSMASGTNPPSSTNGSFHVRGTVNYVDTTSQRIDVAHPERRRMDPSRNLLASCPHVRFSLLALRTSRRRRTTPPHGDPRRLRRPHSPGTRELHSGRHRGD